jgi:hypothetical protein
MRKAHVETGPNTFDRKCRAPVLISDAAPVEPAVDRSYPTPSSADPAESLDKAVRDTAFSFKTCAMAVSLER